MNETKTESPVEHKKTEEKPAHQFLSKEEKAIKNKITKIEEQITELEDKIKTLEESFAKENPSEETLDQYASLKENLNSALQEWEFLAQQLT